MPTPPHLEHRTGDERPRPLRKAVIGAGIYVGVSVLYIVVSTQLAAALATTQEQLRRFEQWKGIGFVVVTGLIAGYLMYRHWRAVQRHQETMRRSEKELLAAELRAGAAMVAVAMAHDLNNMLMSVSGLVEELRNREDLDDDLAHTRRALERGVERMARMARRMNAAAGDVYPQTKERLDLRKVVDEVVGIVHKHPDARFCRIRVESGPPIAATVNEHLFGEALANLVLNGAQAQGPTPDCLVEVRCRQDGGDAVLEVHDAGPGVPGDHVSDIFEPCYTTKSGGSGIGLMTVKAFVAEHGGHVEVERSEFGGALFRLRFPLDGEVAAPSVEVPRPYAELDE